MRVQINDGEWVEVETIRLWLTPDPADSPDRHIMVSFTDDLVETDVYDRTEKLEISSCSTMEEWFEQERDSVEDQEGVMNALS